MTSRAAIRFVAGTKKSPAGTFYLQCHVKPGASKGREGVASITDELIELCVSAQAREGEANKAVVKVLSSANAKQILKVPKSELQITHGLKSRDKTVALSTRPSGGHEDFITIIKERLEQSMDT